MNASREARRDAHEYARAKMFYGEGAGTRRKLITNTVEAKAHRDPEYARAFHAELDRQDMAEHARKARAERRRKDVAETATKNAKAVVSGKDMTAGVGVVVAIAVVTHQYGLDRVIWDKTKQGYAKVRTKIRMARAKKPDAQNNVYHITSVR